MSEPVAPLLWCWRHPRAKGAAGRCIGRTDLQVDRRKARRLAHRIRAAARAHGLPRVVWVSPLQRCCEVGRVLRGWGFQVHVDARLQELDFGAWDGQPWARIAWAEVEAWQADLLHLAPGGGESLAALAWRVQAFVAESAAARPGAGSCVSAGASVSGPAPRLVVTHGGWLNALGLLPQLLPPALALPAAAWPAPPRHAALVLWPAAAAAQPPSSRR